MTPKNEFYFHLQDSSLYKDNIFTIKNEDEKIINYFDSKYSRKHYRLPHQTVSKDLDIMSLIIMLDRNSVFFVIHAEMLHFACLWITFRAARLFE